VADELEKHYVGVPVEVTPNGVDGARFRPDREMRRKVRESEGIPDAETVALFLGGDWHTKGLAVAIEGLAEAWRNGASNLRLWVVGRGDEARHRELARRLGVPDHVRFFGFRPDAERLLQAADIFVLPSLYESFCLSAYEAAACGLPVVTTRVGGVEELIGADEGGILVERTPAAVGQALARLASDRALAARMGTAALGRARRYTWERSVEDVTACYERLLAETVSLVKASA
jgi:glycosyltransferase involved in cell wall biosynthesis